MKKIFESPINGWGESGEKIHVWALEEKDDWWEFESMEREELCFLFNVQEEPEYSIAPGALYHRYDFEVTQNHIIMIEHIAYNV